MTHRENKTIINDTYLDRDGPERTGIDANENIAPKSTVHNKNDSALCSKSAKKKPHVCTRANHKKCAALDRRVEKRCGRGWAGRQTLAHDDIQLGYLRGGRGER